MAVDLEVRIANFCILFGEASGRLGTVEATVIVAAIGRDGVVDSCGPVAQQRIDRCIIDFAGGVPQCDIGRADGGASRA